MYGVNAGPCPRRWCAIWSQYEAETAATAALHDVLLDVLDTPGISPELLPAEERRDRAENRGACGPLRAARFFPVLCTALRLCARQRSTGWQCAAFAGRAAYTDAVLYKWLTQLLPPLFCPAVQAQLPAGRPQGGQRDPFAPGRLAHAQRRLRHPLAGRAGAAQARGAVSHEEQKAFDQYPVCGGGAGHRSGAAGRAQPQRHRRKTDCPADLRRRRTP